MAVAPFAQFPQFLHLGVGMLLVVLDGQTFGVENTDIAAEAEENSRGFIRK